MGHRVVRSPDVCGVCCGSCLAEVIPGPRGTESFSEGGIFVPACTYSGPKAEWLTRRGGPGRADSICKGEDDYGA